MDQRFLTDLARRTIAARLAGDAPYRVGYVPPALAGIECQVVVTLRQAGYARGVGASLHRPIIESVQEAALVALSSARSGSTEDVDSLEGLQIEMQALGPIVPFPGPDKWTVPGALNGFIEPGIDGVRLFLDEEGRWFTPGEMISRGLSLEDAVRILSKEISLDSRVLHESKFSKFRTLHWWEIDDSGQVVTLQRGMTLVPPEDVTAARIDAAIGELARYMVYRQRPDGAFTCVYDPTMDLYATGDDAVMQAGATWALTVRATQGGTRQTVEAAGRALAVLATRVVALPTLPTQKNTAIVVAPDQNNRAALTAETCLALCAAPGEASAAPLRTRLLNGLLWLQQPDGRFLSVFPPTVTPDVPDRAAGQVLLALARGYELQPRAEYIAAIAKAFDHYRQQYAATGSPAMTPWHTQAYAVAARMTKRRDYAEFVFTMSDQVCVHQLSPENSPWPELHGAIAAPTLEPGASTAAFVQGLAEAALLARQLGDEARAERYAAACRAGVRFILQLQFKPQECYYVRSPRDTVGGVRSTPINPRLPLDNCQHALLALMQSRALLFPEKP